MPPHFRVGGVLSPSAQEIYLLSPLINSHPRLYQDGLPGPCFGPPVATQGCFTSLLSVLVLGRWVLSRGLLRL